MLRSLVVRRGGSIREFSSDQPWSLAGKGAAVPVGGTVKSVPCVGS